MCYSIYLSTNSPADLSVDNSDLVRFRKADDDAFEVAGIIDLLEYPIKWFVGSKSECSCTFRHLAATELGFGAPVDWYEESPDELAAIKELYRVIVKLLSSGHHVDCIDFWEGAEAKDIQTSVVSLDEVPLDAFRLFENFRFNFEGSAQPIIGVSEG